LLVLGIKQKTIYKKKTYTQNKILQNDFLISLDYLSEDELIKCRTSASTIDTEDHYIMRLTSNTNNEMNQQNLKNRNQPGRELSIFHRIFIPPLAKNKQT
jgi:hypothetical protein